MRPTRLLPHVLAAALVRPTFPCSPKALRLTGVGSHRSIRLSFYRNHPFPSLLLAGSHPRWDDGIGVPAERRVWAELAQQAPGRTRGKLSLLPWTGRCLAPEGTHATDSLPLQQAEQLGREDQQRLHRNRKLVLMVDLDQTLIHTTEHHCQQMSNKVSLPSHALRGPHSGRPSGSPTWVGWRHLSALPAPGHPSPLCARPTRGRVSWGLGSRP